MVTSHDSKKANRGNKTATREAHRLARPLFVKEAFARFLIGLAFGMCVAECMHDSPTKKTVVGRVHSNPAWRSSAIPSTHSTTQSDRQQHHHHRGLSLPSLPPSLQVLARCNALWRGSITALARTCLRPRTLSPDTLSQKGWSDKKQPPPSLPPSPGPSRLSSAPRSPSPRPHRAA